ncbi:MAG: Smr/MutS family protein, partial [Chloroflexi bacterium]|nr:Smr/MutS family protein [Chloroflexota bacterium]
PGTIAVEELLSEIQRQRDVAQAQAREDAAEREAAQADREAVAEQLRQVEEERRRVVERTEAELLAEAEELRDRLRRISSDISLLEQERRQRLEPIRQEAMAVRRRLRRHRRPPRPVERPRELKVGATVRLRDLGQTGELLTVPSADGEVEVLLGNMRLRLPADRVEPVAGPVTRPPQVVTHRYAARPAVSPELHLRAMRADAALESLEQYLNDAYMAGLRQVRIVHGKGEGILRRLVREELSRHRLVASFRPGAPEEGGEGVTVAEIAV